MKRIAPWILILLFGLAGTADVSAQTDTVRPEGDPKTRDAQEPARPSLENAGVTSQAESSPRIEPRQNRSRLSELFDSISDRADDSPATPLAIQESDPGRSSLTQLDLQPPKSIDSQRLQAIKERIQLLRSISDTPNRPSETQQPSLNSGLRPSKQSQPPTTDANPTPLNSGSEQPSADNGSDWNLNPKTSELDRSESTSPAFPTPYRDEQKSKPSGIPVLDRPVDFTQLGHSLFMIGKHNAALKSYRQTQQSLPGKEDPWIECLVACCQRHQLQLESAEKTFREISNQDQIDPRIQQYANWNLSYIDRRRSSLKDFRQIADDLNRLLPEKPTPTDPDKPEPTGETSNDQ